MTPLDVPVGILHSDWLILLFISGGISALAILRFLQDWKHTDNIDVILLFVSSFLLTVTTVLAGQQDFFNSAGQTLTYQGEYWMVYILWPWSIISWMVGTISSVVLVVTWRNRTRQRFGGRFNASYDE